MSDQKPKSQISEKTIRAGSSMLGDRRCKICCHPDRVKIERGLARGRSLADVTPKGASKTSVWRHWTGHVDDAMKTARRLEVMKPGAELEKRVIDESRGLLEHLSLIRNGLFRLYERSVSIMDDRAAAALAGRLHENLNIIASPDWLEHRLELMRALAPFPEARAAVVEVFTRKERAATVRIEGQVIEGEAA